MGCFTLCCSVSISGCGNNVAKTPQSQSIPVAVATAASSPVASITPKPAPSLRTKYFSKLRLLKPVYNGRKVTVRGTTDLPDGAGIDVAFKVAGRADTDTYLGVEKRVQAQNSKFSAELTTPDRSEYDTGRYEASALFTPRDQTRAVLSQVGGNGEKLTGTKVEKGYGFKMLSVSRLTRHRMKATPTDYVMPKPSDYDRDSSEHAFAEFLVSWKKKDWDGMVLVSQKTELSRESDPADSIKNIFDIKDLLEAKITKTSDVTDLTPDGLNAKDVTAEIRYSVGTEAGVMGFQMHTATITARVVRESAPYKPDSKGEWGVNPTSVSREE